MGEDIDINPTLFELPSQGEVQLPIFEEISFEDIPQLVLDQLNLDMNTQETKKKKLMKSPVRLDFHEGGQVYLFAYDYESGIEGLAKFRGIFTSDISTSGQVMGSGYSLIDLDEVGRERVRPYVGHTNTDPDFSRQGLGLRRLIVLNEANKKWFGDSLGSGSFIPADSDENVSQAERLWERLEVAGLAVKEDEGFRFKSG